MNKWQKIYCDTYYNGKKPRSKQGKHEFELLGKITTSITVHFPAFQSPIPSQCSPARTETYVLDETTINVPKGIVNPQFIAGNLALWESRDYQIDYN